jgi:peptidoglycan hydrolase-like protein with peptidoglycan-binding domain
MPSDHVDGDLFSAVQAFQRHNGLVPDGTVEPDSETEAALGALLFRREIEEGRRPTAARPSIARSGTENSQRGRLGRGSETNAPPKSGSGGAMRESS